MHRKRHTIVLDSIEFPREIHPAKRPGIARVLASLSSSSRMMAFDRTPTPRLEAETLDSLRSVMDRAVRRGNHTHELQDVLARAAAEARDKSIQPEQLLVMMKDLWYSLPELRRAANPERQTELLRELISRCVERYYEQ